MRALSTLVTIVLLGALAIGCALGGNRDPMDGGPFAGPDAGPRDAGSTPGLDAGARDAGGTPGVDAGPGGADAGGGSDAGGLDAGRPDAGPPDAGADGTLDPRLEVPPSGETCATPGSLGECPAVQVCRFYSTTEGRCETCTSCGNLGDPCAASIDCDILFSCWEGECTNFCTLGSFECGPIEDCLDVGHPTRGVCRPF